MQQCGVEDPVHHRLLDPHKVGAPFGLNAPSFIDRKHTRHINRPAAPLTRRRYAHLFTFPLEAYRICISLLGYAGLCRAELSYCMPVFRSSISVPLDLTGEGAVTGTKILWGQMTLSLTAVLAGLWGATEWTAMRLGFSRRSARPGSSLAGCLSTNPTCSSRGGTISTHTPPAPSSKAPPGPRAAVSWRLSLRSPVQCAAHGSRRWSRPMARHAGRRSRRCARRGCWSRPGSISAASASSTSGTPVPSTCCALRRPAAARASAWSCRHCSPGLLPWSCTTSRARTGH